MDIMSIWTKEGKYVTQITEAALKANGNQSQYMQGVTN